MKAELQEIASHFRIEGEIAAIDSLGDGFINDTFIIRTAGEAPDYILQRKNKNIFPDVPGMMENIRKVTEHIRRRVIAEGGDPTREAMTVIPTTTENSITSTPRVNTGPTVFISDTIAYNKADSRNWPARGRRGHRQVPGPAGGLHRAAGRDDQGLPRHPPPLRAVDEACAATPQAA